MKTWATVGTVALAGFALSCSEQGALEPEPEPAPVLALVIRGTVEAYGEPQEGVPVKVEGLHGFEPNPGDCKDPPWSVIARAETTSDASGRYALTLVADSTSQFVEDRTEIEDCVHVMGLNPAKSTNLTFYPISEQWLREESAVDTLDVDIDITSLLETNS